MRFTSVTLFSGGGGADIGIRAAGGSVILAVESNQDIANVYADNFGDKHIRCADVRAVDYRPFVGTDHLHVSPPCPEFSIANTKKTKKGDESYLSLSCAWAVMDAIYHIRPKFFTLENVRAYKDSACYELIAHAMNECGYVFEGKVLNSADFGVPQTRERFIVRAVRRDVSRYVPELLPTHAQNKKLTGNSTNLFGDSLLPWNGWYDAIADLIPLCPEITLANWQQKRLREKKIIGSVIPHPNADNERFIAIDSKDPIFTVYPSLNGLRAVLVDGDNATKLGPITHPDDSPAKAISGSTTLRALLRVNGENGQVTVPVTCPCPTLTADGAGKLRAIDGYRTISLKPTGDPARCIARFQSFPDSYRLDLTKGGSRSATIAQTIIGNAVPPLLMQRIIESLLCERVC